MKTTYETPFSELLSVSSTLTYAAPISSSYHAAGILSLGSMVFAGKQCRISILKTMDSTLGKVERVFHAVCAFAFANWLFNGTGFVIGAAKDLTIALSHGAIALSPMVQSAFTTIAAVTPFFGIVAAAVFTTIDSIKLIDQLHRYIALKKADPHSPELQMIKNEIKKTIVSFLTNAAMLIATIVSITAVGAAAVACPYVIIALSILAIGFHLYTHREDFANKASYLLNKLTDHFHTRPNPELLKFA